MSTVDAARFWDILKRQIEPPAGASSYLLDLVSALNAAQPAYKERAALKLVDDPLQRLKSAAMEERVAFVFEALEAMNTPAPIALRIALRGVVSQLFKGGLTLNSLQAVRIVELVSNGSSRYHFPYKPLLSTLEEITMTSALKGALLRLRSMIGKSHGMDEIQERIDVLVGGAKEKPVGPVSGWTGNVFQEIDRSPKQLAWRALFLHARSLTQSVASRKWQSEAVEHVEKIGRTEFLEAARRWLSLGPMPEMPTHLQMQEEEADYQKGFIWTLGALGEASLAPDIADFAFACFRKIPQFGAVSHRVGNACVNALAAMPGLSAVTQISRLAMRVKYDVAQRLIEKALAEAAERNSVGRDDLEAMSVPSYGLNEDGVRIESAGSCVAKLAIEHGAAALTWSREGKIMKSVPAEVKEKHAELLADLKKAAKELQAVLSTQRLRLERQLLSQTSCPFDRWKAWYLDHPVTSVFAKRLIWEFDTNQGWKSAIWAQGGLVDWTGNPVRPEASAGVRLWHPMRAQVQEVLSWRCWLEDHGVRQPFKQAHREVYLLTDAERQTETFSNRFAAHIVRQHQFAALCRERGWQFNLMGDWDSHNNPRLVLPQHSLQVEFEVDFFEDSEVSGHSIYKAIGTERVRFFSMESKRGRPDVRAPRISKKLAEIPPVIFSEAMRDLDLLVGVASIGADPTWAADQDTAHAEYWQRFADGDLSTAAENRKTILATLVPKLAIRDRCRIEGRYLIVRGESNTYRIHLGSGNVIMEPGSRYLCIVHGPGDTAGKVQLPFEGDSMLAIILSKAFLLANDKGIKDPGILRQIRPA